jgi:hypothetical protein
MCSTQSSKVQKIGKQKIKKGKLDKIERSGWIVAKV